MKSKILLLLLLFFSMAFSQEKQIVWEGYASAYAPGVMQEVVSYRNKNNLWRNKPPYNWYYVSGYVAAMDCSAVGTVATLVDPGENTHRVLVADCAGDDGPIDRFEKLSIVAELDHNLFTELTEQYGRPLRIRLILRDPLLNYR